MRLSFEITIDDSLPVITSIPRGSKAYGKANSIVCPLGPTPTRAWFVVEKSTLDAMDVNTAHSIKWKQFSAEDQTISENPTAVIDNNVQVLKTLTFPGLYLVKSERLLPGEVGDQSALHLIELADARYLVGECSRTGPVRANPRSYANAESFLTGSNLSVYSTWDGLVGSLWDSCELFGTYPGLPADLPIDGVPENTFLIGMNALRALTAVLEQLDCALECNSLTNTYSIVQLGASQNLVIPGSILKFDGEPITTNNANAAILAVHFFYHKKNYGQERDTERLDNAIVIDSSEIKQLATGIPGAIGTTLLWDDLSMVFDSDGNLSNDSAVTTRLANRVARYVTRRSVLKQHRIYIGLIDSLLPGGQVRATRWRNWGEGDNQLFHGTVTEYLTGPDLMTGGGVGEAAAWFDKQLGAPERETYLGPDWGRHTFPNYPRLPNVVQVWHAESQNAEAPTVGLSVDADSIGPNGVKLHRGRVRRWVNNAMAELDPCWILFVDDYDNKKGNVPALQGGYYGPARLCGTSYVSSDILPVYLVTKGGSDQVFVKVKVNDKTDGDFVQDTAGIFKAKIMQSPPNAVMAEIGDCFVTFVDWGEDHDITTGIIAEQGRIYGPAKISASKFEEKPIYEACVGEQEWDGKMESPGDSITKGQIGNMEVYNSDGTGSGIIVPAKAKYKRVAGDKWCIIKRIGRQVLTNQIEC